MKMKRIQKRQFFRLMSRFRTVRGAMMFSFGAAAVLALMLFLLFSLKYTEKTVLENSKAYTMQLVEQVNGDIDSYISYMENIMEIVTHNAEISHYLFDPEEQPRVRERIQEQFRTLMDVRTDICNIAVLAHNGR
ncbi:MAG: histidine kinase, partial [Oscillospiraceae bacterium]|nr:histidine kinase [Oscillospiraceae bacterium]